VESRVQIANRCAPWKIANGAENLVLQALQFYEMGKSGLVCYGLSLYRLRTDRMINTSSDVLLRKNVYRLVA
jgi:hypothetical protein